MIKVVSSVTGEWHYDAIYDSICNWEISRQFFLFNGGGGGNSRIGDGQSTAPEANLFIA